MKKIFLMLALIATALVQNSLAQDSTKLSSTQILNAYYQLKDALASDHAALAATYADELVKIINGSNEQTLKEGARAALLKDAHVISQSKNIELQREKFATLSNTLLELAKTIKLSPNPVYQQYCPMKKASWLSNEKTIKNPYYGNAMLTCGSVVTSL